MSEAGESNMDCAFYRLECLKLACGDVQAAREMLKFLLEAEKKPDHPKEPEPA